MRLPKWTLLICVLAMVTFLVPELKDWMIYDREALIAGQWWRLITGNLVHLSTTHFVFDTLALLLIGTVAELRSIRYVWLVYVIAGMSIGAAIFIASPDLRFYGGLSGIASAMLVYFSLWGCMESGMWRMFCIFLLVLVTVKIKVEFMFGQSLLSTAEPQPFLPSPVSHLAGAVTGLVIFMPKWWSPIWKAHHQAQKA